MWLVVADDDWRWEGVVLVTGTDAGVGKTVVTAAIAAAAGAAGLRVAVVKVAQTGAAAGARSDMAEVARLAVPAHTMTLAEYPEPAAPLFAAQYLSVSPLRLGEVQRTVRALQDPYDLVLVEGTGGLLTPLGTMWPDAPWTLEDLRNGVRGGDASVVVVARVGSGTLHHAALTLDALKQREMVGTVMIGAWPARPGRAQRSDLVELVYGSQGICFVTGRELGGVIPEGAGEPEAFRRAAPGWLTTEYYGLVKDHWKAWAARERRPVP